MSHLDFKPFLVNSDACFRTGVKLDGSESYDHVLLNADDDEVLGNNAERILRNESMRSFELKAEPIEPNKIYLSGSSHKVVPEHLVEALAFSLS